MTNNYIGGNMKYLYIKPNTRVITLIAHLHMCEGSGGKQTTTGPDNENIGTNEGDDDAPTRWSDMDRWEDD